MACRLHPHTRTICNRMQAYAMIQGKKKGLNLRRIVDVIDDYVYKATHGFTPRQPYSQRPPPKGPWTDRDALVLGRAREEVYRQIGWRFPDLKELDEMAREEFGLEEVLAQQGNACHCGWRHPQSTWAD